MILQACLDAGMPIPHYCYHPGLSIPASCRICLVEVEGMPKLVPCVPDAGARRDGRPRQEHQGDRQSEAGDGVPADQPPARLPGLRPGRRVLLQDYSYQYGRSQSALRGRQGQEARRRTSATTSCSTPTAASCARAACGSRARSAGTSELYVDGRGHQEEIDIFPGQAAEQQARRATSSTSARSARCSTRISSSSSASGC